MLFNPSGLFSRIGYQVPVFIVEVQNRTKNCTKILRFWGGFGS